MLELKNLISKIHSIQYKDRQKFYDISLRLGAKIEKMQSIFSFFENSLNQKINSRSIQYNTEFIKLLKKEGLSLLDCYFGLDCVFKFFMNCIYDNSGEYIHIYLCGMEERDFGAVTFILNLEICGKDFTIFTVPLIDVIRTRRWAAVSHEVAHQKMAKIASFQPTLFRELEGIIDDFSYLFLSKPFVDLRREDNYLVSNQIIEMLCDIASVLAVGPSSPFAFLTYRPLSHTSKLSDYPPLLIRIEYMMRILEDYNRVFHQNTYAMI